ncbi:MAG: hypothetical protein R3A45_12420 [Bdellovibrionota bacterium]
MNHICNVLMWFLTMIVFLRPVYAQSDHFTASGCAQLELSILHLYGNNMSVHPDPTETMLAYKPYLEAKQSFIEKYAVSVDQINPQTAWLMIASIDDFHGMVNYRQQSPHTWARFDISNGTAYHSEYIMGEFFNYASNIFELENLYFNMRVSEDTASTTCQLFDYENIYAKQHIICTERYGVEFYIPIDVDK